MSDTAWFLASVGGGILGLVLGAVPGCCVGYYGFREPLPESTMEHPGDWVPAIAVQGRNLTRAVYGTVIGGGLGMAAGLLLAARSILGSRSRGVSKSESMGPEGKLPAPPDDLA